MLNKDCSRLLGITLAAAISWISPSVAIADPPDVCPTGCSFTGIQAALNAASFGATVTVGPGTYHENITIIDEKSLVSTAGAASTVINASSIGQPVVSLDKGNIDGFTITGGAGGIQVLTDEEFDIDDFFTHHIANNIIDGNTTTGGGGGVWIQEYAYALIQDNVISGNEATGPGGGVWIDSYGYGEIKDNVISGNETGTNGGGIAVSFYVDVAVIEGNVVSSNQADAGGGVFASGSASITLVSNDIEDNEASSNGGGLYIDGYPLDNVFDSNKIAGNSAGGHGGGVYIAPYSVPLLTNMLIVNNTAQGNGGGVYAADHSGPTIVNATISDNTGGNGAGISTTSSADLVLTNSIVWGNHSADLSSSGYTVTYSVLGDTYAGTGNINANPLFVDSANGDYSLGIGSPAIDTGRDAVSYGVTKDIDGITRPQDGDGLGTGTTGDGSDHDIGAHEFEPPLVNADVCPIGCPFASIQAALNAASFGATVTVGPGTYYENITIIDEKSLVSTAGAAGTVINASGTGQPAVSLDKGNIDGFTITGGAGGIQALTDEEFDIYDFFTHHIINNIIDGNSTTGSGGGIWVQDYAYALIQDNVISDNQADDDGGGIWVDAYGYAMIKDNTISGNEALGYGGGILASSEVTIEGNVISGNQAGFGGGISSFSGVTVTIAHNVLEDNEATSNGGGFYISGYTGALNVHSNKVSRNSAEGHGGGIHIASYAGIVLKNMLIVDNTAQGHGGGVYASNYNGATIVNATISDNTSSSGNGAGIATPTYGNVTVTNSIVWGNQPADLGSTGYTVTYSVLGDTYAGTGNINANPLFVDSANGDYSLGTGSPAIDTGRNASGFGVTSDIDGVARPQDGDGLGQGLTGDGSDYDIGAYEFLP